MRFIGFLSIIAVLIASKCEKISTNESTNTDKISDIVHPSRFTQHDSTVKKIAAEIIASPRNLLHAKFERPFGGRARILLYNQHNPSIFKCFSQLKGLKDTTLTAISFISVVYVKDTPLYLHTIISPSGFQDWVHAIHIDDSLVFANRNLASINTKILFLDLHTIGTKRGGIRNGFLPLDENADTITPQVIRLSESEIVLNYSITAIYYLTDTSFLSNLVIHQELGLIMLIYKHPVEAYCYCVPEEFL